MTILLPGKRRMLTLNEVMVYGARLESSGWMLKTAALTGDGDGGAPGWVVPVVVILAMLVAVLVGIVAYLLYKGGGAKPIMGSRKAIPGRLPDFEVAAVPC